jgi:hypothetical protein
MAFNVAVGFLAGAIVAPLSGPSAEEPRRRRTPDDAGTGSHAEVSDENRATLDSLMKETVK